MNKKKSVLGRGLSAILRSPEMDITTKNDNNPTISDNLSLFCDENLVVPIYLFKIPDSTIINCTFLKTLVLTPRKN